MMVVGGGVFRVIWSAVVCAMEVRWSDLADGGGQVIDGVARQ